MQELVLAPVTPGAGHAHKERFKKLYTSAQRRFPLQDALDDAAAAGMQAMLQAGEHAAPAQPAPMQSPPKRHLQRPSLALTCGEAAASEGLDAAASKMGDTQELNAQQNTLLPAAHGTVRSAGHRELEDVEMTGANSAQEAAAEVRKAHSSGAPQQSDHGAHAQCHITAERQVEATAIMMEPEQVLDDDLPLTSLFGSAEAAMLAQHSDRSAGRPHASQRPSAESPASLPASQESNQENQLPPADEALHRCIISPIDHGALFPPQHCVQQAHATMLARGPHVLEC